MIAASASLWPLGTPDRTYGCSKSVQKPDLVRLCNVEGKREAAGFGRREPLRRMHECVFAVLALESEPVDPGP
jgi:hypothetical protein